MTKLFNLSEASNIAVHSLALLASSDKPLSTRAIARMLNFSRNHIAKVMQTLTRYGIVSSGRGPSGGFVLRVDPDQLSIYEICEMIDGRYQPDHCRNAEVDCPFEDCIYGDARQRLYEEFKAYYSRKKLSYFKIKP